MFRPCEGALFWPVFSKVPNARTYYIATELHPRWAPFGRLALMLLGPCGCTVFSFNCQKISLLRSRSLIAFSSTYSFLICFISVMVTSFSKTWVRLLWRKCVYMYIHLQTIYIFLRMYAPQRQVSLSLFVCYSSVQNVSLEYSKNHFRMYRIKI